jgi:probable HAF family extracellular repeat protein
MVGLGDLPGGTFQSYAAKVSGNGSVVVGYSNSANGTEAFRLTLGGSMIPLGDLPGGTFASIAQAVNADGSVIAGSSATADGYEAFVWDSVNGMRSLGDLPGGAVQGAAADVSADGAIIVGGSISAAGDRAFIWDSTHHMRDLQDVLVNECGLNLSGWSLNGADGISDDGLTIVGIGVNPQGKLEGWIAVLPEPANAAILLPCLLGFSGLRRRRTR